jgi:hypothetical protein
MFGKKNIKPLQIDANKASIDQRLKDNTSDILGSTNTFRGRNLATHKVNKAIGHRKNKVTPGLTPGRKIKK